MADEQTPLAEIEAALRAAGMDAQRRPAEPDSPIPTVIVPLEPAPGGQALGLTLSLASDAHALMRASGHSAVEPDDAGAYDEFDYLQFFMALPFTVVPAALDEVARLVLRINAQLPLVGFGLDLAERSLYFRHMMILHQGRISRPVVVRAARMAAFIVNDMGPRIEAVASGQDHSAATL